MADEVKKLENLMKEKYGVDDIKLTFKEGASLQDKFQKLADVIGKKSELDETTLLSAAKFKAIQKHIVSDESAIDSIHQITRDSYDNDRAEKFKYYNRSDQFLPETNDIFVVAYYDKQETFKNSLVFLNKESKTPKHEDEIRHYTDPKRQIANHVVSRERRTVGYSKIYQDLNRFLDKQIDPNEPGVALVKQDLMTMFSDVTIGGKNKKYRNVSQKVVGTYTDDFLDRLPIYDPAIHGSKLSLTKIGTLHGKDGEEGLIDVESNTLIFRSDVEAARYHNNLVTILNSYIQETYNIVLQKEYEKNLSKTTRAAAWQTKKHINLSTQEMMETTSLKGDFSYVEIDNDVDLTLFHQFEAEAERLMTALPKIEDKQATLRLRKLGNYKALGLFASHNNTIALDFRSRDSTEAIQGVGIQSFIHEYGHYLDYNASPDGNLSLQMAFEHILKRYQENFDNLSPEKLALLQTTMPGNSTEIARYFKTPTEVFARAFELYVTDLGLDTSLSHTAKFYRDSPQYQAFDDRCRQELFHYMDKQFPELKDKVAALGVSESKEQTVFTSDELKSKNDQLNVAVETKVSVGKLKLQFSDDVYAYLLFRNVSIHSPLEYVTPKMITLIGENRSLFESITKDTLNLYKEKGTPEQNELYQLVKDNLKVLKLTTSDASTNFVGELAISAYHINRLIQFDYPPIGQSANNLSYEVGRLLDYPLMTSGIPDTPWSYALVPYHFLDYLNQHSGEVVLNRQLLDKVIDIYANSPLRVVSEEETQEEIEKVENSTLNQENDLSESPENDENDMTDKLSENATKRSEGVNMDAIEQDSNEVSVGIEQGKNTKQESKFIIEFSEHPEIESGQEVTKELIIKMMAIDRSLTPNLGNGREYDKVYIDEIDQNGIVVNRNRIDLGDGVRVNKPYYLELADKIDLTAGDIGLAEEKTEALEKSDVNNDTNIELQDKEDNGRKVENSTFSKTPEDTAEKIEILTKISDGYVSQSQTRDSPTSEASKITLSILDDNKNLLMSFLVGEISNEYIRENISEMAMLPIFDFPDNVPNEVRREMYASVLMMHLVAARKIEDSALTTEFVIKIFSSLHTPEVSIITDNRNHKVAESDTVLEQETEEDNSRLTQAKRKLARLEGEFSVATQDVYDHTKQTNGQPMNDKRNSASFFKRQDQLENNVFNLLKEIKDQKERVEMLERQEANKAHGLNKQGNGLIMSVDNIPRIKETIAAHERGEGHYASATINKYKKELVNLEKMAVQSERNASIISPAAQKMIDSGVVKQWAKKPAFYFVTGLSKVALEIDDVSGDFKLTTNLKYQPKSDEDKAKLNELLPSNEQVVENETHEEKKMEQKTVQDIKSNNSIDVDVKGHAKM